MHFVCIECCINKMREENWCKQYRLNIDFSMPSYICMHSIYVNKIDSFMPFWCLLLFDSFQSVFVLTILFYCICVYVMVIAEYDFKKGKKNIQMRLPLHLGAKTKRPRNKPRSFHFFFFSNCSIFRWVNQYMWPSQTCQMLFTCLVNV